MADHSDKMLDHDYDGIRELDNELPRWWVWLFYVTIIFAIFYMIYYDVLGIGYSSADAYLSEMDPNFVREQDEQPAYLGLLPYYRSPYAATDAEKELSKKVRPVLVRMTRDTDTITYIALMDDASVAEGRNIYMRNCASCHGNAGEGGVGPNLTDDYWLHGAEFNNIVKTVKYGFPTKGMISWLGQLTMDQIIQVSSYVTTLHGTSPPNPKAPEGELVVQKEPDAGT
jgi:cytochrome c oxidase cbb3-type subunit 3